MKYFCKLIYPPLLLADNGFEFNSTILYEPCLKFPIKKHSVLPYNPASNGILELQNRKNFRSLCSMVGDVFTKWLEWRSRVTTLLNSSLHGSIGETPHHVIFGQDKKLTLSVLLQKEEPIYKFDDWVCLKITVFQKIQTNSTERSRVKEKK